MVILLIIKLFKYKIYPRDRGTCGLGEGHCPSGPVNKTTTTLLWRGHARVSLTVDATYVNEPHSVKLHSVRVFIFIYFFSQQLRTIDDWSQHVVV